MQNGKSDWLKKRRQGKYEDDEKIAIAFSKYPQPWQLFWMKVHMISNVLEILKALLKLKVNLICKETLSRFNFSKKMKS